ncbi:MAG: hypothetical protein QME45_13995 [Clostridiales bacterium]|nr:hypothetical protein [Clostridiales bacterium]
MSEELKNFINDLIIIVQEKYNDSLKAADNENEHDKAFRQGANFAYYDALDIIESQLKSFSLIDIIPQQIVPILGQETNGRDTSQHL